jgi:hypothetical protein
MESIAPAMVAQPAVQTHVDLRKAPKWLRKPAGSTFAVTLPNKLNDLMLIGFLL